MSKPFDPTKPVQTRNGNPARIICTNKKGNIPIVACVTIGEQEVVKTYCVDGYFFPSRDKDENDLINIPPKKEGWSILYQRPDKSYFMGYHIFDNEEEAKTMLGIRATTSNYNRAIKIFKIEW